MSGVMNPASPRKLGLICAQFRRQRKKRFNFNSKGLRPNRRKILANRVDTFFAAYAAAAGNRAETLSRIQFYFCSAGKIDNHDVLAVSRARRSRKFFNRLAI